MVWPMIIAAGATLIAANQQSRAAQSAADTTAAATREAAGAQQQQFERQVQLQEPWRKAGEQALNKLFPLATEYTPFGMQQFQQDPGYAFRLSEGQKALERSAAARGGLMSGSALKAAQRYGQDLGSQEYMNAFNRYQTEREARLNPLQSLANVGQTSSARLGEAGQQYATNVGNLGINQAQLAGQAGLSRASSYGNAVNQLAYLGGRYMENDQNQPTFGYSGG
jgi:hypothetical protein